MWYVTIDDSNVGKVRIVGPIASEEAARALGEHLEQLVSNDPFVAKRVRIEWTQVEEVGAVLREFFDIGRS